MLRLELMGIMARGRPKRKCMDLVRKVTKLLVWENRIQTVALDDCRLFAVASPERKSQIEKKQRKQVCSIN